MRDYDFQPPAPVYPPEAQDAQRVVRLRRPVGLLILTVVAALTVVGLGIAAVVTGGRVAQPAAAPTGTPLRFGDETDSTDTRTPLPTTTPEPVQPGTLVPITMNAQFTQGLTVVEPKSRGWSKQEILNRPGQLTLNDPGYAARFELWQTGLYTSAQSDESLTETQLLRIGDECLSQLQNVGEPEVYVLQGRDGTKLELLGQRAVQCDGGEIVMYERLMPHSGTRIHIVLWSEGGEGAVAANAELQRLLRETSFTIP